MRKFNISQILRTCLLNKYFFPQPSHAEKSNNPEAKKLLSDLYKARKELKGNIYLIYLH